MALGRTGRGKYYIHTSATHLATFYYSSRFPLCCCPAVLLVLVFILLGTCCNHKGIFLTSVSRVNNIVAYSSDEYLLSAVGRIDYTVIDLKCTRM